MRLKYFDNYLIASMSIFGLISLYMLYGVKFHSQSSEKQIQIASIVEQIKTVKRKRDFYQSWVDVNPGDTLSQNDEIYTHGQSSAKINFVNGPQISLFENSLLRIKNLNKQSSLSLDKGNLTATLTKESPKLDVVLNGKKYSFESHNANIQIEQGANENKFLLLDGKAKLKINESSQVINENQVLIQNKKTGDLKIKELPFILKTPLHNSVKYFSNNITIPFKWAYTAVATPAKIIIATDSRFKDIVLESSIENDRYSELFTKAGIYYWKLVSASEIESPIRTFTLIEEKPLLLNLDREIVYIGPKRTEKVFINWTNDSAKKYLLKIKSPDNKTQEIELKKNNYELLINQAGIYNVSVKIQDKNRPQAIWSEASPVEGVIAKDISITSNTPEFIEKINYKTQTTTQLLSWNGPRSGVNYTVKLTKNNISKNLVTENLSMPISLKEAGEYLWEIKGETESGIISNIVSGKIIIKTPLNLSQTPAEGAVIELERPDQLVSFKWDEVESIKEYQFELASDSTFNNIIHERIVDSSKISTALAKTGRYFWRVKIKKGETLEYSQPVSVEIKPSPPLEKPENLPSLKIKIKYLEGKTSQISSKVNFSWLDFFISKAEANEPEAIAEWDLPANSKAKEYIVEIYQDENLTKLITRIHSDIPHIVWKKATLGTFYWRVSYIDYWGRQTEFSKASTLSTELDQIALQMEAMKAQALKVAADAAIPIELINPKHREDILEKLEDEYVFSWVSLSHAKAYRLMIASDLDFENTLQNFKTKKNELRVSCSDLKNKSGDYYWKVTTPEGNTSKRRMFHVNCAPEIIEAPVAEVATTNEEEKKNEHFAKVGIFPHSLNYTNTSTNYSAKVSGNVLNSVFALYQRPVDWKYFQTFTPSIWMSRGKVFNTLTFTDMELNFKAARDQTSFSWGPTLAVIKKTLYVESNLAISAQGMTSPLLGIFIQKDIGRFSMNAEIKFGGMLDYHADIQYALKNKISVGAFFDATSVTKDTSKHSFSRFGLNLNYTFPFLDLEK